MQRLDAAIQSRAAKVTMVLLSPFVLAVVVANAFDWRWVSFGLIALGILMVAVFVLVRFVKWAGR